MAAGLSNPNPVVYQPSASLGEQCDPLITEIFGKNTEFLVKINWELLFVTPRHTDLIRDIKDPEHPHTLEELNVIRESDITLTHPSSPSTSRPSPSRNSQSSSGTGTGTAGEASSTSQQPSLAMADSAASANFDNDDREVWVRVQFTPTVPHCSLATLI